MFKKRSSILILTLWSISFLTLLLMTLGYGIRQKLSLIKRLQDRQNTYLLAEAGLIKAISFVRDLVEKKYFTLNDINPNQFQPLFFAPQGFYVIYNITDEQAKININKIEPKVLERLFVLLGFDEKKSEEMAYSIVDWRDSDSNLSLPLGSAEDSFYRAQEFSYEAKDADFELLEELLLVKDIDQNVFERIKNYLTIHGDGKININTADPIVLRALGIEKEFVEEIINYRNGKDSIIFTSDDNFFESREDILEKMSSLGKLQPIQIEKLHLILDKYLTTNSDFLKITSICKDKIQREMLKIEAIVDRQGKIVFFRRF